MPRLLTGQRGSRSEIRSGKCFDPRPSVQIRWPLNMQTILCENILWKKVNDARNARQHKTVRGYSIFAPRSLPAAWCCQDILISRSMFYTNIFCGKNWRHEDYEFYSIWPVQNGSIGPVLCRWLLHAVSRKMRTQQTGDCCVIVGTGLLNNSQYAHLNNIQRRLGILHSFLAYILLWYASDLLQRYSAFGRNATANIHKHKLWAEATLCQIPLPLLKSRIEMVLPLLLLTSAASSAVGRHLMGANMMWPDPCRILIIYQTR